MKKALNFFALLVVIVIGVTGCGVSDFFSSDQNLKDGIDGESKDKNNEYGISITTDEDKLYKELVLGYFEELFKGDVLIDEMHNKSISGELPANLKKLIAEQTLFEGLGNPEIPIHLPRFVEINGYTSIEYSLLRQEDKPQIELNFLENANKRIKYFVKVDLLAKCLRNNDFNTYYKFDGVPELVAGSENSETVAVKESNIVLANHSKVNKTNVPKDLIDMMKIQTKYDVELVEEDGQYKVFRAIETNAKLVSKYRLARLNNDFVERKFYLDPDVATDKTRIEREKAIINKFFNKLVGVDKIKMDYIKTNWDKSKNDFTKIMTKFKLDEDEEIGKLLVFDDGYKTNFKINEFPIQNSMMRIEQITNIAISEHPSYTEKENAYIVEMEVLYQNMNEAVDTKGHCKYIYDVKLNSDGDKKMISRLKLIEYKLGASQK